MSHTERANYPPDLTDEQWQIIHKLLPPNSTPFSKSIDAQGDLGESVLAYGRAIFPSASNDSATVIPDLEPLPLNRLDEMEIFAAVDFAENDITDAQRGTIDGLNPANSPGVDLSRHRATAGAERIGLGATELLDVRRRPTYSVSSPLLSHPALRASPIVIPEPHSGLEYQGRPDDEE